MHPGESNRVRWGILGTGSIASTFVTDLLSTGHAVTAVGSRGADSARSFAQRFGIQNVHASYESLVSDSDVDIVYVATPHVRHAADAVLALRAGKHVLVEKPFALNAQQARAMVGVAERSGLLILEAMWTRWLPHMVRIRELLAAGALGDVRAVIADHSLTLSDDPRHRINAPELGGGALLDLGIYPVSFAWDVLGRPRRVDATASFTSTGVDQSTSVILRCDGGGAAVMYTSICTTGANRATIQGTRARIEIDPVWYGVSSFSLISDDGQLLERFAPECPTRGMDLQADEAERLIAEGSIKSPVLPPEESIAIMSVLDEVRRRIGLTYPDDTVIREAPVDRSWLSTGTSPDVK
jgi:predicted dehydrogenase